MSEPKQPECPVEATPEKFYLTTPIYYVNARPHIGHAYSTLVADVLARRHRLLGHDTFFLTGTDEHGQKIERSAAAAGIPPQQFADQVSKTFSDLWLRMGITNDAFIRTTETRHKQGVQKLFRDLYDKGHIYLSTYTGQYSIGEEMFVDGPPGTLGPDGRPTETVTEENFFFRLSAFQEPLLSLIEADTLKITPESSKNEVLSFVRGGLKDLSVSRSSFTWGIPVPDEVQQHAGATQKHVIYVWLDALANYMTAIGYGSEDTADRDKFAKYWPADLHLVGKEITRFHCVYWPAFLLAAGLPTPKQVTANGWLLFDNAKMSKSKGNVVRTETILDGFGEHIYKKQFPDSTKAEQDLFAADVLRYFLLREIPFGQDGTFSFDSMITRYNADLANGYGNLVSRTLSMVGQYLDGEVPVAAKSSLESFVQPLISVPLGRPVFDCSSNLGKLTEQGSFWLVLMQIQVYIKHIDEHLSRTVPWKLAKDRDKRAELENSLALAVAGVHVVTVLLYAFIPYSTAKVWQQLGLGDIESAAKNGELKNLQWGGLQPGTKLGPSAQSSLAPTRPSPRSWPTWNSPPKPQQKRRRCLPKTPASNPPTPTPTLPLL